jgi:hypothetical protein
MIQLTAVKRVLRYLKGTSDYGIRICPTTDKLIGHADSDWAGDSDRKSVSGFVATLGDVPVAWWSKKQTAVALSSTEAVYASLSETPKEIMWLRGLCKALGHNQNGGTMIMQDSTGSLSWANGTAKVGRSKHVDIKLHQVQHLVQSEEITLQQVGTSDMKPDFLTKRLEIELWARLSRATTLTYIDNWTLLVATSTNLYDTHSASREIFASNAYLSPDTPAMRCIV